MPVRVRKRYSAEVKMRVLHAARVGEDWKTVVRHNEIPLSTAWTWIYADQRSEETGDSSTTDSDRNLKITDEHIAFTEGLISETPTMTLEMAQAVELAFGVTVSPQCIMNRIDGICYLLKQLHREPLGMNNARNKAKRHEYVLRL
ncbi:TPA: hypothetical protein N0F65_001145 [Lagenidium giganteum]|uniref:Transposase n=1 Tax=Lagenidium giganteum TaxID=4803 RepID=A0AAV2Z132_9STRA|nr:TPA: hypothetical protein N0F65_001145 [Lagenidium giganteum]